MATKKSASDEVSCVCKPARIFGLEEVGDKELNVTVRNGKLIRKKVYRKGLPQGKNF